MRFGSLSGDADFDVKRQRGLLSPLFRQTLSAFILTFGLWKDYTTNVDSRGLWATLSAGQCDADIRYVHVEIINGG